MIKENEKNIAEDDAEAPIRKVYCYKPGTKEREISSVYTVIDTDLARDNLENDLSAADLQDL